MSFFRFFQRLFRGEEIRDRPQCDDPVGIPIQIEAEPVEIEETPSFALEEEKVILPVPMQAADDPVQLQIVAELPVPLEDPEEVAFVDAPPEEPDTVARIERVEEAIKQMPPESPIRQQFELVRQEFERAQNRPEPACLRRSMLRSAPSNGKKGSWDNDRSLWFTGRWSLN